jgi:hypothetical protein
MSQFMIWSRVEVRDAGGFTAIVTAIPCDSAERLAPEERTLDCGTRHGAEAAATCIARSLSDDIHARGGRASRAPRVRETSSVY